MRLMQNPLTRRSLKSRLGVEDLAKVLCMNQIRYLSKEGVAGGAFTVGIHTGFTKLLSMFYKSSYQEDLHILLNKVQRASHFLVELFPQR